MKRIIIICEGQTEQVFCDRILSPYFISRDYHIQAPTIKHTRGGIVKWDILKKQVETHLLTDRSAFVTTLIDYYGLYQKHSFPEWDIAERNPDKIERMNILERGMKETVEDGHQNRFIPYMQLHEFEGLLFNDINIFHQQIPATDLTGLVELEKTFRDYDNPEMINNNRETSPSHRLERIITGYNKVVYGDILAEAIGLNRIRQKSPRFDNWIKILEKL
jgi:hypothetical protein